MPGLQTAVLSKLDESTLTPTSATYTGTIDTTWCIGSVPQGGYSLSIILNAVLAFMRTPEVTATNVKSIPHLDPFLLSATYIQAVTWTPFEVRIRMLKRGKSLSNLQAEMWQGGVMRITCQVVMTDFKTMKQAAERMKEPNLGKKGEDDPRVNGYTITEGSQWAVKYPLSPPERCEKPRYFGGKAESGKTFNFGEMLMISIDPKLVASTERGKVLEAGAYYALIPQPAPTLDRGLVESGRLSEGRNLIPFLADMFLSPPQMIPGRHKSSWYPTLHLTIEFKRPLPEGKVVERTGTYSKGRWMVNGQHESDTELWSHPDDQHLFEAEGGERRSFILAIARQTALVLPMSVNENKTKAKAKL